MLLFITVPLYNSHIRLTLQLDRSYGNRIYVTDGLDTAMMMPLLNPAWRVAAVICDSGGGRAASMVWRRRWPAAEVHDRWTVLRWRRRRCNVVVIATAARLRVSVAVISLSLSLARRVGVLTQLQAQDSAQGALENNREQSVSCAHAHKPCSSMLTSRQFTQSVPNNFICNSPLFFLRDTRTEFCWIFKFPY